MLRNSPALFKKKEMLKQHIHGYVILVGKNEKTLKNFCARGNKKYGQAQGPARTNHFILWRGLP